MELQNIGEEKMPSVLKDPFNKNSVKRIYVSYRENIFGQDWYATGCVEFLNGSTKGEQEFKGASFDEVVAQIKVFLNELK